MQIETMERRIREMLAQAPPRLAREHVCEMVEEAFEQGARLLDMVGARRLPLWVLERSVLRARAGRFRAAFDAALPRTGYFFAVKSNNHPEVARTLVAEGFGLDVSSGLELAEALAGEAREIVFSGPGKTPDELALAVAHAPRVTVLIDSFSELHRLAEQARGRSSPLKTGVRITPPPPNRWRKFGIPIDRLAEFFHLARQYPEICLAGIQFHSSWNLDPSAQEAVIAALGKAIVAWPDADRPALQFLDIGGGFWPEPGEWLLPKATERGQLLEQLGRQAEGPPAAFVAQPIETFAERLARALRRHVLRFSDCRVCFEPGRYLCNDAMHLFMRVVDKKAPDLVVTDAGTNAIGWERFESDYCPVLNLSRPAIVEHACEVVGSLCTPHDYWGFSYWGASIEEGDVLMIPRQGAYTWSLRQQFIKPLPEVAAI